MGGDSIYDSPDLDTALHDLLDADFLPRLADLTDFPDVFTGIGDDDYLPGLLSFSDLEDLEDDAADQESA